MEHSIIVAINHMLDRSRPYHDPGADYFTRPDLPDLRAAHHVARLHHLAPPNLPQP
ncbi:hypothetical protein [Streptomyces sp. NBC_01614]|uniref:hypothetical protein n=1 Tax=Streptomyces sp. NBC_01614 TaxID=2975897 RepID=UPI00386A9E64